MSSIIGRPPKGVKVKKKIRISIDEDVWERIKANHDNVSEFLEYSARRQLVALELQNKKFSKLKENSKKALTQ